MGKIIALIASPFFLSVPVVIDLKDADLTLDTYAAFCDGSDFAGRGSGAGVHIEFLKAQRDGPAHDWMPIAQFVVPLNN